MLAIKGKIKAALFYPIADHRGRVHRHRGDHDLRDPGVQGGVHELRRRPAGADADRDGDLGLLRRVLVHDLPAIGGGIYGFFEAWKRSLAVQKFMDRHACCKLPVFGDLVRKSSIARWTRTLSTMFAAGVPLVEALDSVGGAAGNYVYCDATKQIQSEVSTGTSLTVAMQNAERVPDHGAADGARSARKPARSTRCSARSPTSSRRRSTRRSRRCRRLMEPMIMVVLGALIGGMVIAMYLPIFKLGQAV